MRTPRAVAFFAAQYLVCLALDNIAVSHTKDTGYWSFRRYRKLSIMPSSWWGYERNEFNEISQVDLGAEQR